MHRIGHPRGHLQVVHGQPWQCQALLFDESDLQRRWQAVEVRTLQAWPQPIGQSRLMAKQAKPVALPVA
ncbi:hypothetical protein D3C79_1066180 [compost metagenome]